MKYYLNYDHINGQHRSFNFTTIEQFAEALDRVIEDPEVVRQSIKFETK